MKTKDLVAMGFLALILVILGSFLVNRFGRGGKVRSAQIEIVQPIDPNFDNQAREILLGRDPRQPANSFSPSLNFGRGLGNNNPFRSE